MDEIYESFKIVPNLQSRLSVKILDKYGAAQHFIAIIYWTLKHMPHAL